MDFRELAWGAFIWMHLNKDTWGFSDYNRLTSNKEFLLRLQNNPSLEDFEELRGFLVHFGVHQAPKRLAEQYISIWSLLKPHIELLRGQTLESCDFSKSEIREAISSAFGYLQWPHLWGGDVVASKVLHFFNIELFVMWDTGIQISYGKMGTSGYVEFLETMQSHAVSINESFRKLFLPGSPAEYLSNQLSYELAKSLTKFLDDYNWVVITKKWPNTIPDWLMGLFVG